MTAAAERLPPAVRMGVQRIVKTARGGGAELGAHRSVGGGSINRALRLEVAPGHPVFVKWNPAPPPEFFAAEVDGLEALRARRAVRVPGVLGWGHDPGSGAAWLVLEYLPPGRAPKDFGARLGHSLAELHRPEGGGFGWERDNFIGSLPQSNRPRADWGGFWRDERLLPQIERARSAGHLQGAAGRALTRVVNATPGILAAVPADGASLVHGDLWSGNVHAGAGGEAVLVDPAVYRGDREVDLAMAELFGGFPSDFLPAYREAFPLGDGYPRVRRDLYQLYPLLVHVNLFGGGYVERTLAAAARVLHAL